MKLHAFLIVILLSGPAAVAQRGTVIKFARYAYKDKVQYGIVEGDLIIPLKGDLYGKWKETSKKIPLAKVSLLPPCQPSKVLAMGLNFKSHTVTRPKPEPPITFPKLPTCIIGPDADIIMPGQANNLHFEGELVVVFKKKTKNISEKEVKDYILGVTAGNDVTERSWQKQDKQWLRGKSSDTFGPIGPFIVTGLNYDDLLIETRLNGVTVQSETTESMYYSLDECVSYLSYYITFLPGDVLFLGTPGKTKAMKPGDIVEVEIEGIGVLRNTVKKGDY